MNLPSTEGPLPIIERSGQPPLAGVSIVVPVFNGATGLEALMSSIDAARSSHLAAESGAVEVILVNDGSTDGSWEEIERLACREPWVRGLDLLSNVGQHAALLTGAGAARYGIVVTMDDDLQHPPTEVAGLIAALRHESAQTGGSVGLVYGTPLDRGPLGLRRTGSWLARLALAKRSRSWVALDSSAFRAFDARFVPALMTVGIESVNIDVALVQAGASARSVRVRHDRAQGAKTRYTMGRLARAAKAVAVGTRATTADGPVPARQGAELRAHVGFMDARSSRDPNARAARA